jgi:hypothetical protein
MSERMKGQRGKPDPARGAYELSDLDGRAAGLTVAGLAGLVVLVAGCVLLLFLGFGGLREPRAPVPQLAAPAPALEADERSDRTAIEAPARRRLKGHASGVPIGEAMRRTDELGWDAPR